VVDVPAPNPPKGAGTPKPYYQDDLVTLYCGDSLHLVDVWRDLDVMITDPPYGLQALAGAYGTTHRTIANDMDTETRDIVLDLWGDKPIAVFASPRLEEPPGTWSDRLVWDKAQLGLNGGPWRYAHESIFVRGDGWRRIGNTASSIMRYPTQANRKHVADHIHSKPMQLLAQLVAAAPAGTIIDPFAGGGSTVAAAVLLGRPIVAIELTQSNCDLIIDRIQQRTFDLGVI
jgi:site-specific DNA-methyltransferase (adenine-specific)